MKPVNFRNALNGELVVCNNVKDVHQIDGVDYLLVHRPGNDRLFLMRKDALIKDTVVKKPQYS